MTDTPTADVVRAIESCGIIAVIRLRDPEKLAAVAQALTDGGVRALEVTMTVPHAIDVIAELADSLPPGLLLGAGTVLDAATARRAIEAGARFIVGPVFRPEIIDVCHRAQVAAVPGCFTPTEIHAAWQAGADIVKLFPAGVLGPDFIRDLRAPLPQIKLMPTGGVTLENAGIWIKAGAVAVGLGSALVEARAVEAGDYDAITTNARRVVANVCAAREGRS